MGKLISVVLIVVCTYFIVINSKDLICKIRKNAKKKRRLEETKDCESVSIEKESQDK